MTPHALTRRLAAEGIVSMELAEWEEVREAFMGTGGSRGEPPVRKRSEGRKRRPYHMM